MSRVPRNSLLGLPSSSPCFLHPNIDAWWLALWIITGWLVDFWVSLGISRRPPNRSWLCEGFPYASPPSGAPGEAVGPAVSSGWDPIPPCRPAEASGARGSVAPGLAWLGLASVASLAGSLAGFSAYWLIIWAQLAQLACLAYLGLNSLARNSLSSLAHQEFLVFS